MTEIGDALTKAIDKRNNDINLFVWKYQNGKEVRLMDMNAAELQDCLNHVTDMLYNKHPYRPGKLVIRENIQKAYNNCNAELLLRYILYDCNIDRLKTNKDLTDEELPILSVSYGLSVPQMREPEMTPLAKLFEHIRMESDDRTQYEHGISDVE